MSVQKRFKWSIEYTITDEAPQLATYALLPVLKRFITPFGVEINTPDISLAARILCHWNDKLPEHLQKPDALSALGELTQQQEANIVKLPNISASVPQLKAAIKELQDKGYPIPDFPENPKSQAELDARARYGKALGSAVNPVLREGNSDRRVALPVKRHAQQSRPPVRMRDWSKDSKTHVASMTEGDFFGSEQSATLPKATSVSIVFEGKDGGEPLVLKKGLALEAAEVIDAAVLSKRALRSFFAQQFAEAKEQGIMLSLHLKATMMKVSDPIIFGHAVSTFLEPVFEKHSQLFRTNHVNPNLGLQDVLAKVMQLPEGPAIKEEIDALFREQSRGWAMVDSGKGITNLHVPNDVIIDASMPPMVRDGGKMWNQDDALEDTKALIPDRSYATIYAAIVEDCREHGQFDHSTMGSVANVGLMARKAEEYGSHDKTFEMEAAGVVRVVDDATGADIFKHTVEEGDIFRMCQTKDEPIKDWVRLAVDRARKSDSPAIFWLDEARAHDRELLTKVHAYLKDHDLSGLSISIKAPADAMRESCALVRAGKDVISVTGNVLRDYLTDLFPILELGTSAKMLSIVPLLKGGGLFETGAGGSAPKHVEQLLRENHIRWDSLGEYLAVACSLEHLASAANKPEFQVLADTLNAAVERLLRDGKGPSRKVMELGNRGSTFYLSRFWAEELAKHESSFKPLAQQLIEHEDSIVHDFISCQGKSVDTGGYFLLDEAKAIEVMRPSDLFNRIIDAKSTASKL